MLSTYLKQFYIPLIIIISIQIIAYFYSESEELSLDSKEYLSISENIFKKQEYSVAPPLSNDFKYFQGESPTRMRQPIYPIFLSATYWLSGEKKTIVFIIQSVFNILSFLILLKIARKIFGDKLFVGSVYIIAFYFPFWMLSMFILTESLFSLLLFTSIYFMVEGLNKNQIKYFVYIGFFLGLAFLTRPIAIFIIFFLLLPTYFFYGFPTALKKWGIMFVTFLLIISPWFIRNAVLMNDFTPLSSDGGYNFWCASLGINKKPWIDDTKFSEIVKNGYYIDSKASDRFFKAGIKNFNSSPIKMILNGFRRIIKTWTYFPGTRAIRNDKVVFFMSSSLQVGILIFAFIGFIFSKNKLLKLVLLIPAIGFTSIIPFSYSISRFLIPVVPFMLLLSGEGIAIILKRLSMIKTERLLN